MEKEECVELCPSELGTKEYWDNAYSNGIKNFQENGIIDDGWFEDSVSRMVRWLSSCETIKESDHIADLGCGNGVLLIELAREGFKNLKGLDYSANAVKLATAIAQEEGFKIDYEVFDLLSDNIIPNIFDVCIDNGTYDAISLHGDDTRQKRLKYIENTHKLLKENGFLLITSCNWTQQELISHFTLKFKVHHIIPTPAFKFKGKTGNVYTSMVFIKQ